MAEDYAAEPGREDDAEGDTSPYGLVSWALWVDAMPLPWSWNNIIKDQAQ